MCVSAMVSIYSSPSRRERTGIPFVDMLRESWLLTVSVIYPVSDGKRSCIHLRVDGEDPEGEEVAQICI